MPVTLDVSPGNLGFRPSSHSAVQRQSLALPDTLPTGLDNKLWWMRQAVYVHFLAELHPLVHLQQEIEDRLPHEQQQTTCQAYSDQSTEESKEFTVLLSSTRSADSLIRVVLVFFTTFTFVASLASLTNRFLMAT